MIFATVCFHQRLSIPPSQTIPRLVQGYIVTGLKLILFALELIFSMSMNIT